MPERLLQLHVNGRRVALAADDHTLLVDVLRERLALTGTKQGCDGGECGACTVLVDGEPRLACITLAAAVEGRAVETIESLSSQGRLSALQRAFHEKLGTQCGFCTPGMVMAAEALLRRTPQPSEAQVREAIAGNLCRCTGYVKIIDAVLSAPWSEPAARPSPRGGPSGPAEPDPRVGAPWSEPAARPSPRGGQSGPAEPDPLESASSPTAERAR